ncbi:MAG: hypothetical protein AB1664_12675 [Thermodesulfobacteriota bacterium]
MRPILAWISIPLAVGIWGWLIWSALRSGDWQYIALFVAMVVAMTGLWLRKIWGKYLVYFLAVTGVLWVAHVIWLEIVTGRFPIPEGGPAQEIGAPLATIIVLSALVAILFLLIGSSYVVHCQYKKMERDRYADDVTGNSSLPSSQSSDTH